MKRILILLLAVLMCVTVVSCSSEDEPDLAGTTLEGYEDVPIKKLIREACENYEKEANEDSEVQNSEVTYKFSYGWATDKFDEGDYVGSNQSAITCTISVTATIEGHNGRATMDFYFVHNHETNTLKIIGCKYYRLFDMNESTSFGEAEDARELLSEFLDEYDEEY